MTKRSDGSDADELSLSNEYAQITIRKVSTRKGEQIEIESPKLGYRIRLDPVELESLTWQDKSIFSDFLLTPYGPDDEE
jgi:hypothetical protein